MTDNGIITEDIAKTIALGQIVYDSTGKTVGSVDFADREHGYVTVRMNSFSDEFLYIPFRLITNIDPRELFLSLPKEQLDGHFRTPPPHTTVVDRVAGRTVATTSEPSGYNGRQVVIEHVRLDDLRQRIAVGGHVYTWDLKDLGAIKRYDPVTGWMLVEKGVFSKHDLMIPITVVDYANRSTREVYLTVSESDLKRMQRVQPVDVVFVDAQITETRKGTEG